MSLFGDISGAINSATTSVSKAVSSVSGFLNSGPAAALSAITGAFGGAFSSLGLSIKPLTGVTLPLKNPLFAYATYDYVLGLSVLTKAQLNKPDTGYMKGQRLPLIAKTANADPSNRISTPFGQFDYFLDKLEIESTIGLEKGANTNMHKLSFKVTEPYSMGTFMMSLQEAAWSANHDNYLQAPYLLTIDFRGNTETGKMDNIPATARKIPFKFKDISMTVTEEGSVYQCSGYPVNSEALSGHVSELKTDGSVKGVTVQEVLQTGEKSLQVMLNKRLQQLKDERTVNTPDKILIIFPLDISSEGTQSAADENSTGATTLTASSSESAIVKQLRLKKSTIPANGTLVQEDNTVNEIGRSAMGFSDTKKGDTPVGKDNQVIKNGNVLRANNTVDKQVSDMRFSQDTDITTAIDAVLLSSDYSKNQLQEQNIDSTGMRKWWRIDTQVFQIEDPAAPKQTGTPPRIIVYRVVPYGVHTSAVTATNTKAPGFKELEKQVVKVYDYMFTGKNVDILSFHIEFKAGFAGKMGATSPKRTADNKRQEAASGADDGVNLNEQPLIEGATLQRKLGVIPSAVRYSTTKTAGDNIGGGGLETQDSRSAKQFHDAITSASGMLQLDMKIIGDPYYIAQSGMGNYTSAPTQFSNLNTDGSVSYQGSEVDIVVNFRTPIDINQSTGLYDFGKSTKSAPVLTWSGLYQVIKVTSYFDNGSFTQVLKGPRRNGQELSGEGSKKNTLNTTNSKPDKSKDNE
jgi:hypothetical protein